MNIIDKIKIIESEHQDFFVETNTSLIDYISEGQFGSGVFINTDLPKEIADKVRKAFDNFLLRKNAI